jgi:hypothetical protein
VGTSEKPEVRTMHIPAGVSLSRLKARYKPTLPAEEALQRLRSEVTADLVLTRCTAFGDGRELLRTRPWNGLFHYVWLLALAQKQIIASVPVTALQELEEGIYSLLGEWVPIETTNNPITMWLDAQVLNLVRQVA